MNIGVAGTAAGLPAKTIRYYEDIGLICPARAGNGYRHYSDTDVHKLAFLARARSLGFSIEECRQLLSLYVDRHRASADVKRIAQGHPWPRSKPRSPSCRPCTTRCRPWSRNVTATTAPTVPSWRICRNRRMGEPKDINSGRFSAAMR